MEHYRAIANGAEVISDFQVMGDQAGLLGPVALFLTRVAHPGRDRRGRDRAA